MRDNEIHILQQIRNGDQEGFRKLFELFYKRLYLYAVNYLEDPITAEDLVQDLLLNIWERRKKLNINSSLSSYLYTALHNRCIHYLRHIQVRNNYQANQILKLREAEILLRYSSDFSIYELELDEMQNIINTTFTRLPDKTREIFEMSRKDFLTNQEIADRLKVNIKTIEYHISKALTAFREALSIYS